VKKALITGVTGQCGSYLTELLLGKGYEVHGIVRRSSSVNRTRIDHLRDEGISQVVKLHLHYGDLLDGGSLSRVLKSVLPDEVYNLGAQSHVRVSFDVPEHTADVTGLGATRLFDAIRDTAPESRVYQASSSEMFGATPPPQNESTQFHPRSPYAAAKLYAYWYAVNMRESYRMHISNGILFNNESPRRGETFVTRKITRAAARIRLGKQDKLFLGNLDAKRDWGYAGDYVEAMWLMLQQDEPDDYVIATGEMHSVREFVEAAFAWHDLDWTKHVEIDPRFFRPAEVDALCGDASKARRVLGWQPKTNFNKLVEMMCEADFEAERRS
jgi:GDPmannose 4,6-dehydratase